MAIFPTDKTQPFVADNGVVYVYEDDRWRVKSYKVEDDARLPYRIETDKVLRAGEVRSTVAEVQLVDNQDNFSNVKFTGTNGISVTSDIQGITFDGAALMGDISIELDDYATKVYSDNADQDLQNQIDALSVSKGKVARYITSNTIGTPVSRPGELSFSAPYPPSVTVVSFGIEDADNVLTKPMADGDIIEFVDAVSGKVSRYKVTDASGAPTLVAVEYISGDNDFATNEEEQVYIYPQNEAGATKEYVDAQDALKLAKAGDAMKGLLTLNNGSSFDTALEVKAYDAAEPGNRRTTLTVGADGKFVTSALIKSTRNTGYAFEVKPDDGAHVSYLHTNGNFLLGGNGEVLGNLDISTSSSTGVRILGSFKVKKDGESIGGANVFEAFGTYVSYYGDITADNHIATKKYVDDNGGGGVVIYSGPNPPPTQPRGTLLMTTNNVLYVYTT